MCIGRERSPQSYNDWIGGGKAHREMKFWPPGRNETTRLIMDIGRELGLFLKKAF
jgi:hypothetical protein